MKKLLKLLVTLCMLFSCFTVNVLADGDLTVIYDANGGTGTVPVDSNTYSIGDEVTVLANEDLTNSGYVFDGWNTMSDGRGDHYQAGHKFSIARNTTLYAIWAEPKVRIQIVPSKDSATGTVEYKFDTDANFTTYSGDAPISIPSGATKITFKAVPDESFVLLDCTILYKGEDIDEEKGYKDAVKGDGYEYTLPNDSDTVFKAEFAEEELHWHTISWGGGNVRQEHGQVIPDVIHVGDTSYGAPFDDLKTNTALKDLHATYSDGDLFVLDGITEDVSIDFHFIPDYGYQVTDVRATEDSLLDSFTTGDEISTFTFAYEPETNVHFEVEFTDKEDIIDLEGSELVNNANISNGENAINSGNLKLEINDVDSEDASQGLKDEVDSEDAQYIQMELSQVVDKAVSEDTWDEEITEFDNPIEVSIEVNDLDPMSDYYIVREHTDGDGQKSYDQIDVNRDGNNISFETNKFSTYALVRESLGDGEFKVEYDERRDDEGNLGASVEINDVKVASLETKTFTASEPIEFTLNSPDDRASDIPFVEIEVFDGDEETGNTLWATYLDVEDPHRLVINDNKFSFTPGKENPFIVRVIWSEYDWFGPEDGQYMIETNIFNNGTIVPSIDSVRSISHGYNQRKDCYTVGEDLILTLVPGENVFGDEEELEFVAIGADLFTKDGGEDEDEFTRPLSDLWNEKDQCYQIIIEDPEEFSQWYIEAHFTGETYRIIEGKNSVINIAKGNDATFVSNADISKFVKILIDGHEVDSNNYKKEEGSTKVILKAAYLKSLDVGKYVLEIVSIDGSASTLFTITNDIEPEPTPKPKPKPYIAPKTGVE